MTTLRGYALPPGARGITVHRANYEVVGGAQFKTVKPQVVTRALPVEDMKFQLKRQE